MKLLFTVPHYYHDKSSNSKVPDAHGSLSSSLQQRTDALSRLILSLHQCFGPRQTMINLAERNIVSVNSSNNFRVTVAICTTGTHHLLNQLSGIQNRFTHYRTNFPPKVLGFACHQVLKDCYLKDESYDFYGFLEDDLVIHDPLFFQKLSWFNHLAGNDCLLLPNRFEKAKNLEEDKAYIDGDLRPDVTSRWQDITVNPEISRDALGQDVIFRRPLNPHSGCFFLTSHQMRHWMNSPHSEYGDLSFVSPLESAATLGIMKTFKIYKPAPENANFLEIEHADKRFIHLIKPKDALHPKGSLYNS